MTDPTTDHPNADAVAVLPADAHRRSSVADLEALLETAAPILRPAIAQALQEHDELVHDLGGADALTAQQRACLADYARLGWALITEQQFYARTLRTECLQRIEGLTQKRRALMQLLGLKRIAREVSLDDYLEQGRGRHAIASSAPIKALESAQPAPVDAIDTPHTQHATQSNERPTQGEGDNDE